MMRSMPEVLAGSGNPLILLLVGAAMGIAAVLAVGGLYWVSNRRRLATLRQQAERIIADAEREAEQALKAGTLELQEKRLELKAASDQEAWEHKQELDTRAGALARTQEELSGKAGALDGRMQDLAHREGDVAGRETAARAQAAEAAALLAEQRTSLERLSGMTAAEAKDALLAQFEAETKREFGQRLRQMEEDLQEQALKKAQHLITTAIERCAVDTVFESSVTVVNLANDEMKGRIIGRDGRNIHALQNVTGIDFVVDDTPGAVILSGFDPVRRETARRTLERLLADGRIHPARIEEVYAKAQTEVQETIEQAGEEALRELGITGVHPEIVRLLGRLKYRTSYGQNVLNHSKEVAYLCGMMAAEYGLDDAKARRAGLLHDIGKAVSHEAGGAHALIGGEAARRFGEPDYVVNAVEAHHHDVEQTSPYAVLAEVGDAISAARPGARRDQLELYLKRLTALEKIALDMPGVERAFAVQAGRELRVVTDAEQMTDAEMLQLSRDIAHAIEEQLEYPGRIRVTCIRETRAVEYAM